MIRLRNKRDRDHMLNEEDNIFEMKMVTDF